MSAEVSTPLVFVGTFRAMSETPEAYDAIIIGAGAAGIAAISGAGGAGARPDRPARPSAPHQVTAERAADARDAGGSGMEALEEAVAASKHGNGPVKVDDANPERGSLWCAAAVAEAVGDLERAAAIAPLLSVDGADGAPLQLR